MIAKFYFPNEKKIKDCTPWKTIIPPSCVEGPFEYFRNDPQCENISEDEIAFLFDSDKPVAYMSAWEYTEDLYIVDMFYNGTE